MPKKAECTKMLLNDILEDIKVAMKAKDKLQVVALRTLHSDIKNVGINTGKDITDEIVIDVISKTLKQKNDSVEQFLKGNRQDLVDAEEAKAVFYQKYLPKQLSEDEILQLINQAISESGATCPKDMGKVMKIVTPQTKGKADGKTISQLVQAKLRP